MVEPITLFSAIAGCTSIASRLTVDLTRLTVTLKNVPDQITQVCNEMVSLNATLTTLQQRFNPMSSGYSQEQLMCLETVIASTRETLVQLSKLSDACEVTGKKKTVKIGFRQKIHWTLNDAEIASYRSGLVSYTTMLNLLTATLADQRGANIEAMVTKTNTMLETLIDRKKRLSIVSAESDSISVPKPGQKSRRTSAREGPESIKIKDVPRSRSVAPATPRRASSSIFSAPSRLSGNNRNNQVEPRAHGALRSASASHLPLPSPSLPPPTPTSSRHCLSSSANSVAASSFGMPTPPPEYSEFAPPPGMRSQGSVVSSAARSEQQQIVRTGQSRSRARSVSTTERSSTTTRSRSSGPRSVAAPKPTRPTYERALSSASSAAVEARSAPAVTPVPKKETIDGHKLEFAGQWRVKEIRINDSFMGTGTLHLKKDDAKKRVLVNLRLDSSKETRLSYRWIDSSSATKIKPQSMFGGPSYVFRSLVRADDYSGQLSTKASVRLEDITYLAGQRSLMIALNLIQQSPPAWLVDFKSPETPSFSSFQMQGPFYPTPPMTPSSVGGNERRGFFRNFRAPSTPSLVSDYPPSESLYQDYPPSPSTNYQYSQAPSLSHNAFYSRGIAPPSPPSSPSECPTSSSRRPSISSSIYRSDPRVPRASYDQPVVPPKVPTISDVRMRGAERSRDNSSMSVGTNESATPTTRKEGGRSRRGPAAWFTFGR